MKVSLSASCLCKGVKFITNGEHRNISNCHCIQCRKTHGIYGAYSNIGKKNIRFLNKKTLRWFKSSKKAKRGFCNKCGASIFFKVNNTKNISIAAGIFDKPTKLKTFRNIFVGTKSDFYKITDKLPKFKKYPKKKQTK
tara:strand:+ start:278 stop:691 length:414 start_codon:yes stop_codon:yes gene_type:complete